MVFLPFFWWFGWGSRNQAPSAAFLRRTVTEKGNKVEHVIITRGRVPVGHFTTYFSGLSYPMKIVRTFKRERVPFSWKHPFRRYENRPLGFLCSVQPKPGGAIWTIISEPVSDQIQVHLSGAVSLIRDDNTVLAFAPTGTASWSDDQDNTIALLGPDGNEHWATLAAFKRHNAEDRVQEYYASGSRPGSLTWREGGVITHASKNGAKSQRNETDPTFQRTFRVPGKKG